VRTKNVLEKKAHVRGGGDGGIVAPRHGLREKDGWWVAVSKKGGGGGGQYARGARRSREDKRLATGKKGRAHAPSASREKGPVKEKVYIEKSRRSHHFRGKPEGTGPGAKGKRGAAVSRCLRLVKRRNHRTLGRAKDFIEKNRPVDHAKRTGILGKEKKR